MLQKSILNLELEIERIQTNQILDKQDEVFNIPIKNINNE